MIDYVIAGLALGAIYAMAASGLIVTYVSAGILNFAFGPIAYFLARLYYFLNSQQGWPIVPAAVVTIAVAGPAIGVFLYVVLFRHLARSTTLIKVVVTIGLSVAVPAVARLVFGDLPISQVPGLSGQPVPVFRIGGININLDQVIVFAALVLLVVVGGLVLRFTSVGLRVRATVDSAALTSLCGVSPQRVAVGVWAVGTMLAALAGVLVAPVIGLVSDQFVVVMCAAIAAVIAARLSSLGIGIVAGLLMGVVTSIVQWALPSSSPITVALLPSIPFVFILGALVWSFVRRRPPDEASGVGGALDRAITPVTLDVAQAGSRQQGMQDQRRRSRKVLVSPGVVVLVALVAVLPLVLGAFWVGLLAQGLAFAVVFLSFTVMTGQGGMIWLNHSVLAGVGGLATAQFATNAGLPSFLALLLAGVAAALVGLVAGVLTTRLGTLYVALVTLSFGLLIERLAFADEFFAQGGSGVPVSRPDFMADDQVFAWVALAVFCALGLVVFFVRRSTAGLALAAVRSTEPGARSLGISIARSKLVVAGLASFVAGIGGGLLVMFSFSANPQGFTTLAGLTWLAVVVSVGIRTNSAALVAGVFFAVVPGIFSAYVPAAWGELPTALFGLGAILVARNPDGVAAMHAAQLRWLVSRTLRRTSPEHATEPGADGVPGVEAARSESPARASEVVR